MGTEWYHRQALEAQLLIDSWEGVSKALVPGQAVDHRNDFMFPLIGQSMSMDKVNKGDANTPNNKRVRIFQKWENGNEVELNQVDKALIRTILNKRED